ncbi:MAG TPA: YHS domain-containing protein [Bacillota bacterium]|jgi:YHS domain-containing protein
MAKDPVCGMTVDEGKAAATAEYQGQTYYFCSAACKAEFEKDPKRYAGGKAGGQPQGGHGHHGHCC